MGVSDVGAVVVDLARSNLAAGRGAGLKDSTAIVVDVTVLHHRVRPLDLDSLLDDIVMDIYAERRADMGALRGWLDLDSASVVRYLAARKRDVRPADLEAAAAVVGRGRVREGAQV